MLVPPVKNPTSTQPPVSSLKFNISAFQFPAVAPVPSWAVSVMVKPPVTVAGAAKYNSYWQQSSRVAVAGGSDWRSAVGVQQFNHASEV